jgi:branched-chain amino acid transport system substrate-binding protein
LATCAALAACGGGTPAAESKSDPITVGAVFDLTGGLNIYGIQQNNALQLAVKSINESGGVLGRQVKVASADAQSDDNNYVRYVNTLIRRDRIAALFAGLTSSSREAIRPIVRQNKVPYFYSSLYEGGACDKTRRTPEDPAAGRARDPDPGRAPRHQRRRGRDAAAAGSDEQADLAARDGQLDHQRR